MGDLCRRCGKCCRLKITTEYGFIVALPAFCPQYEVVDGKGYCRIYTHRHDNSLVCLAIKDAIHLGVLPDDCPYVPPGYATKVINYEEFEDVKSGESSR